MERSASVFSISSFFQTLEELDRDLLIAESDILRNEKFTGNANLCISAITRLELVLQNALLLCADVQQTDLDMMLQYYSQTLILMCGRITSGSSEQLYTRLSSHERNFEQFFAQRYPDKPLPPPEEEGAFYTPEIVQKYQYLLQDRPVEEEWPWVSRKHLRLCMFMLEQVRMALNFLVMGQLPKVCSPQREVRALPEELNTPKAKELLEKLRDSGLLNEYFQPEAHLSLNDKAILAQEISRRLWGENRWAVFQEFWGINHLSSLFSKAIRQPKAGRFIESINEIL